MRFADLASYNEECGARRAVALVTDVGGGAQRVVSAGTIAGDPLAAEIAARWRSGQSGIVEREGRRWFLTVRTPPVRLVAIGAVHISQALAAMAKLVDLDVAIVDPRTAFATPERFPDTTLLPEWPADVLPGIGLDAFTAVALLTHDPKIDDGALVAALRAECFYIGALGSRKTHSRRLERMRAEGFDDTALGRIHAPIGLDIGALTPAEIAVAIIGEIVAARRRKPMRLERTGSAA